MKKNVLITGSEGFIGQYLVNKLCQNKDYKIYGIDNLSKHNKQRDIKYNNYNFVKLNICSPFYQDIILDIDPHIIIDMASVVGGINKINNQNDVIANLNIFNQTFQVAQKLPNLEQYIFFSSSIVYDRINTFPTPELSIKDIPAPNSPYGYYKYTCEYLINNSELPWTIIRPYNCIGIGDDNEKYAHVFTDFIRQAKRNGQIRVKGGKQYRAFIDCEDIANIIDKIVYNNCSTNQIYNLGNTNNYISIERLALLITNRISQCHSYIIEDNPNERYDVKNMMPNIDKILKLGYYSSSTTFYESLNKCIEYYN
jgi:nucleoside-diphosphate-sugar epimerase